MLVNFVSSKHRYFRNSVFATILTLILIASVFVVTVPTVAAKDVDTYLYLSVAPNPVGVTQTVYVIFWLSIPPPTAEGAFGDVWEDITVTVTEPDGTTETLGPYDSDAVGSVVATYVPAEVGTYQFQASYPGQVLEGNNLRPGSTQGIEYIGDTFLPSESNVAELTVQQEAVESSPDTPLPTGYWARPVYGENHN